MLKYKMEFKLLDKLWAPAELTFEIAINESRLQKYLWIEILINSEFAGQVVEQMKASGQLKEPFIRALSWYQAFKCSIFINCPNKVLDGELKTGDCSLLKISLKEYTLHIRNLIKGLQCINYI